MLGTHSQGRLRPESISVMSPTGRLMRRVRDRGEDGQRLTALIVSEADIGEIFDKLARVIKAVS